MTNHDQDTLIKGVIYARYSSAGQREESIEGQIRDCTAFAEQHGIRIIGTYEDRALTGTSDKRPAFQRMIRDSARGQFTVVICWKNDRFARSRYDSAIYKAKLKQNGVRILYAKESIPEGPEGIILESIMEGYAEYYSANLSQNIKRGNYDSALKLQTCGVQCFGLRTGPDKRFEIDPVTGPIVKRIFEDYIAGKSAKTICDELNSEGWRTVQGNEFNKNSVRRIIQNERYCGVYEHSGVRDENGVPPIVDRQTWEKAQKVVKAHQRNHTPEKTDSGFLLTGKLFCGHCGAPMIGESGRGKLGKVYYYYTCRNVRAAKKKCDKLRVRKDYAEDLVISELAKLICNDEQIEYFADCFMAWQEERDKRSPVMGLSEELKDVSSKINNFMGLIERGLFTDAMHTRLMDLEARKAELEASIAKARIKEPDIERDAVVWFLNSFRDGSSDDPSWRIYMVDTFLKAAYLYDDKLTLFLNLGGEGGLSITFKDAQTAENAQGDGFDCCDISPTKRRTGEPRIRLSLIKGCVAATIRLCK